MGRSSRRGAALLSALGLLLGVLLIGPEATASPASTRVDVRPISVRTIGTIPAAAGYPHYGQHSAAVRSLQNKLIASGLLKAQFNSGTYGKRTRTAVSRLQRNSHLPRTGKVNAATAAALTAAVKAATGPPTWNHQETIGRSADGRAIVAYRAGDPSKPAVVVVATMHGEENFGQYVARGLLEGRPIADVDLWVVPVLNPDGLARDRRWIKGHVDLNRNFPNRFIRRANSGPKAASGKETRVIMAFLDRINPRFLVSWHQPLHGVDSYRVKNKGLRNRLAAGLRLPRKSLNCHGSCHGTMTGWFNAHHDGAAITVEYGATARSMKTMKGRDANAVLSAVGGRRL